MTHSKEFLKSELLVSKRARRESLGGSDAAAVLGLNPWSSRFDAWWSKLNPDEDDFASNQWIYWGHAKEAVIGDHYAKRHGVKLIESPTRYRPIRPWHTGTPDRLIIYDKEHEPGYFDDSVSGKRLLRRGLEIKTGLAKHKPKWHADGCVSIKDADYAPAPEIRSFEDAKRMVPINYYVQCCWYMELMGYDQWDLCVLLDSSDYREYRIHRDPDFISWAVAECQQFWTENVEKRREPPLDHGKSVNKYLAGKYTEKENGLIKIATPEENKKAAELKTIGMRMKELIDTTKALKASMKDMEQELYQTEKELQLIREDNDELCAQFRDAIGADKGIETELGLITWVSTQKQARTLRKRWKK